MQKLVHIFFALLAVVIVPSCRTTKEVHHYDTLTIERAVEHVIIKHDTVTEVREVEQVVTVHDTVSEVEHVVEVITHHIYDTTGRVREVIVTERGKDKVRQQGTASAASVNATEVKAQGSTVDSASRDSASIKQGSRTDEKKKPSTGHNLLMWIVIPIMLVVSAYIFIKLFK